MPATTVIITHNSQGSVGCRPFRQSSTCVSTATAAETLNLAQPGMGARR